MARRIRDWFFTVPFLIAFCLTLVVFDIAGRIARPFGMRPFEWVMAALQRTLISVFRICGTTIEVTRSPAIEPGRGYALISNHQSLFDIVLIGGLLFSNYPKYVAKQELAKWIPSISLNLNKGGNAVIDRGNRRQAVAAIEEMAKTAQARDVSVVIFPEGTRSRDGQLGKFRRAGSITMLEGADQLPVVPVTIDGSWRLLRYNLKPIPFGTTVRIEFGDPIPRTPGDSAAVSAQARQVISDNLDRWRGND
ncbi:MAG: 1-acyl-sn-glycerol-3-phosphate acyltransferase [Acidimicrobiales bacterium]|nr:1-acyl-sn-glycerol-3-phosphate acyltransferase [Acidimicrobiales bacterium]